MSETGKAQRDDMPASSTEGYDDRLRGEEEKDHRSRTVLDTSSAPSHPSMPSFKTIGTFGHASVINVGRDININVNSLDEDEEIEKKQIEIEKKKKDKEICHWLAAPDPTANYHAAREIHHTQTDLWFIHDEKFGRWKKIPNRPLWLSGSPGCGKTIIISCVIDELDRHCQDQASSAHTYFFFDARNAESNLSLHDKFIRSLILQLWHQLHRMPAALSDIYGGGPMHPQPSTSILEDILRAVIGEYEHVYIVIDALDECTDRHKLLTWIKNISCREGTVLHMVFSSRRESDIIDHMAVIRSLENMHFAGGSANPDIVDYVNGKLSEKPKWSPEVVMIVKHALIQGADGRQVNLLPMGGFATRRVASMPQFMEPKAAARGPAGRFGAKLRKAPMQGS
ncbi:hypothetical protein FIBSPDRAFT_929074 [Athelia psychrophila]|uniref:NACHT domain-containing protein n=1 Tax=Athelia psychrophila TaxID=1759441 RepID=A0A166P9Y2_9AGAM|nr:hypothetical protein FIBSPDRAFT_929074 [Fibularhizoctonia sp. CBS 109695]